MPADETTRAILRLSLVPGIGPRLARQLLAACGPPEDLWQQPARSWQAVPGIGKQHAAALKASDGRQADAVLEQCLRENIRIISICDDAYPEPLKPLEDSPLVLFAQGDSAALHHPRLLAVVGTRKPTREGRLLANRWSRFLAAAGVAIVSGMAYGIDEEAHKGALAAGVTLAVLGCGLAALPAGRRKLAAAIALQGCLLSEFTPATPPRPEHFPRRNRIIAGLSHATLVLEAGLHSGALITAHQAADYGREVFAVPGSVLGDAHAGCHQLLREGAEMATCAQDVMQQMAWQKGISRKASNYAPASPEEAGVIRALGAGILHIDQLAESLGLTVAALSPILIGLELVGVVECLPGSRYALAAEATAISP